MIFGGYKTSSKDISCKWMPVPTFTGLWLFVSILFLFFYFVLYYIYQGKVFFTLECNHTPTLTLPGSAALLVEVTQLHRQPHKDGKRLQEEKVTEKDVVPSQQGSQLVALSHIIWNSDFHQLMITMEKQSPHIPHTFVPVFGLEYLHNDTSLVGFIMLKVQL